ncbi:tetratricopeptide repeat protein [Desulfonatronovibrio hydrogenovorans]|uniref:tetratricopeptide repeat protein n=1 Tax=Desulfonatronovibrio hydrogenovorans TaxID=53245 RepID=UPI001376650B|nr:tetratricopeptide repeat protein [Desulfonatronovibrio hydrogenovorans]
MGGSVLTRLKPWVVAGWIWCIMPGMAWADDPSPYFTVQIGSYELLEKAEENLDRYLDFFPQDIDKLRIEDHPPFFALRAGLFRQYSSADDLRKKIAEVFSEALILRAYYLEDRILSGGSRPGVRASESSVHAPARMQHEKKGIDDSIVPASEAISDSQARFILAELLIRHGSLDSLRKAEQLISNLRRIQADSSEVDLLQIRLEALMGNRVRVTQLTEDYVRNRPFDPDAWLVMADIASSLGHFARSRDMYLTAIDLLDGAEKQRVRLIFAERTLVWGDYYASETIVREALNHDPDNPELMLVLSKSLIAQQRFVEGRAWLDRVIRLNLTGSETYFQAWTEKINLGLQEKDYARASADANDFLFQYGPKRLMIIPGARAYYESGRFEESEQLFAKALGENQLKSEALIGLALLKIRQNDREKAAGYLSQVGIDSEAYALAKVILHKDNPSALFGFLDHYLNMENDPSRLMNLAHALAKYGYSGEATTCFEAALVQDHRFFPARIGLAKVLPATGRYTESLDIIGFLANEFPDNYKLGLTRARVLAWSRQYQESIAAYNVLLLQNPDNATVLREAARTAYWGKMASLGNELYQRIYTPSVDEMLLQRLENMVRSPGGDLPAKPVETLAATADRGLVVKGYEEFIGWYEENSSGLDAQIVSDIEQIKHDLNPVYINQKRAVLEKKTKDLVWNRRFAPARRELVRLTSFDPGNQEALFDLAQVNCSLSLCDQEREVYEQLLRLEPLHGQAGKALERQKIRSSPRIFGGYAFWKEKGRGDLARMTWHSVDLGVEVPFFCRHSLRLITHKYMESPQKYGRMVHASGLSLEGDVVTGPDIIFSGRITHKSYDGDLKVRRFSDLAGGSAAEDSFKVSLEDISTGYLDMRVNFDNYAALTVGYEKRQEMSNVTALAQGIYSDRYKAHLDVYPSRKLDLSLVAEYIDYNDNNHGYKYGGEIGYAFTDHPRQFKTILSARYRDTSKEYQACPETNVQCSIKNDFKHPYWTPQDYWGAALTFAFRHDLAEAFFCGAREHFYELKLTLGTEKDNNDSVEVKGLWQREVTDWFGVQTQAMWHHSREWQALAGELGLFFRF